MPRRAVLVLAVLAAVLMPVATAAAGWRTYLAPRSACPHQTQVGARPATKVKAMRCMINWAREKRGRRALRDNARLDRASRLKLADDSGCNEFSHTPCGKAFPDVFRRSGYLASADHGYAIGENIAFGTGSYGTPRAILLAWLRSDGHRRNLFSRTWREMGIAYRFDAHFVGYDDVALWANDFGRRY